MSALTVFLAELDTAVRVALWVDQQQYCNDAVNTCASATNTCWGRQGSFSRTLDSDMFVVSGVTDSTHVYALVASQAAVFAASGKYYWDAASHVLSVSTWDAGASMSGRTVTATVVEPLAYGQSLVIDRSGTPVFYEGRVDGLPAVTQALTPDELGAGSAATFGNLLVANEDGRYDRLLGQRLLLGQAVRIYKGSAAPPSPTADPPLSQFTLWASGIVDEVIAGAQQLNLRLTSIARLLDGPVCRTTFAAATYPAMDPNIAGVNVPRVYGTAYGAKCFRIASGVWKVAGHALVSISAVYKRDGSAVTILSTTLASGQFTVSATYDTETALFCDCRGFAFDKPGEQIISVVTNSETTLTASQYDTTALAAVDTQRAVSVGFQALGGTLRDLLNLIAASAFVDWYVSRTGVLTARVRSRTQGNLVANGTFDTGTTGWATANGATLSRVTTPTFRGAGALQIVKPAPQALAYAVYPNMILASGTRYTATLMAAVTAGATASFRISITDSLGNEFLSDAATLSATKWTRITLDTVTFSASVIYCDSTTTTCANTTPYTCATAGGDLRVYPEYNGADAVTVVIDDVDCDATLPLDDTAAVYRLAEVRGPIVWRARAGYARSVGLGLSLFAEYSDTSVLQLYPTAESRELAGYLIAAADAVTVATAVQAWFSAGRARVLLDIVDMSVSTLIDVGTVLRLSTSRVPSVPGASPLYRVVQLTESYALGALPKIEVAAEGLYDPYFSQETITAA